MWLPAASDAPIRENKPERDDAWPGPDVGVRKGWAATQGCPYQGNVPREGNSPRE